MMKRLSMIFIMSFIILAACTPTPQPISENDQVSTKVSKTLTALPTITQVPPQILIVTNTPQPTSTPEPTPTNIVRITIKDDKYTESQKKVLNSAIVQSRIKMCQDAIDWATSDSNAGRAFLLDYVQEMKIVFDSIDENKVTDGACVFTFKIPDTGKTYSYTIYNGDFSNQDAPRMSLMPINPGDDQHVLLFQQVVGQGSTFVRVDKLGKTTQFVNKHNGEWTNIENAVSAALSEPTMKSPDDFSDLKECRNWREAEAKCPATLDDLKSGRLVEFAKKVMKPFPPDAYQVYPARQSSNTISYSDPPRSYTFLPLNFVPSTDGVDEKTKKWMFSGKWGVNNAVFSSPLSPVADKLLFLVKSENNNELPFDLLTLIVKLKTKSGKEGYYVLVRPPDIWGGTVLHIDRKPGTTDYYHWWLDNMAYQPPLYYPIEYYRDTGEAKYAIFSTYLKDIIDDPDGQRKKFLDDWIITGDIPIELEKLPLFAYISCCEKDDPFFIHQIPANAYPKGNSPTFTPTVTPTRIP